MCYNKYITNDLYHTKIDRYKTGNILLVRKLFLTPKVLHFGNFMSER